MNFLHFLHPDPHMECGSGSSNSIFGQQNPVSGFDLDPVSMNPDPKHCIQGRT
jgi:hypothetical protein